MSNPFGLDGLDGLRGETLGDNSVCVAVLDGPVDLSHPALASAALECRRTLVPCRAGTGAATRHGTQVASILFGRREGGVEGVAPGCRGLILPIFAESADSRTLACSQVDLTRAISRAVEGGAKIINISGGQSVPPGGVQALLADVLHLCEARGVLVVAAAGNDGCDCLHLPASFPNVLTVGALDRSGRPLVTSNWGAAYRPHGVMAPGENLPGALPGGGIGPCTGTSFATALVSGVAALLVSLQVKLGHPADAIAIGGLLLRTARGCHPFDDRDTCRKLLSGRLDVAAAMKSLLATGPARVTGDPTREAQVPAKSTDASGPSDRSALAAIRPSSATGHTGHPRGHETPGQAVYPIGRVAFERTMDRQGLATPIRARTRFSNLEAGLAELDRHSCADGSMIWTLEVDTVSVYALEIVGPHAFETDRRLRQLYREQGPDGTGRVAMPGRVVGERSLPSGLTVVSIAPELRGMNAWTSSLPDHGTTTSTEFLERVASGRRNPGVTPSERALNFCWPLARTTFEAALDQGMELDEIATGQVHSPVGRVRWQVDLIFYKPVEGDPSPRQVHRFTVDVSDVLPVLIDGPRVWSIR